MKGWVLFGLFDRCEANLPPRHDYLPDGGEWFESSLKKMLFLVRGPCSNPRPNTRPSFDEFRNIEQTGGSFKGKTAQAF
jgi:hypothetical protein